MADERFEDRHRKLRAAAEKVDHRTAYDLTNAWPKLQGFEARTGPLVDDLVAAVREEGHYPSCSWIVGGECECPYRFIYALDGAAVRAEPPPLAAEDTR